MTPLAQPRGPDGPSHAVPDDPRAYLPGGDPHAVLQPGVLAYFAERGRAEQAGRALESAGLGPVSIERFHPQPMDRARLDQAPSFRLDIENHVDNGLPLDKQTQTSTLVAVAAQGEAAQQALHILRAHGGRV